MSEELIESRNESLAERRSRKLAEELYPDLFHIPKGTMYIISHTNYAGSLDWKENDYGYLRLLRNDVSVSFDDGVMYANGTVAAKLSFKDNYTQEATTDIDKPLLDALFSIVLMKLRTDLDKVCPPGYSTDYTWMKSVKNIRASVTYPVTEKFDQADRTARVEGMAFGGGLIDTGDEESVAKQFLFVLSNAGRRFRKKLNGEYPIQGIIRTISFSEKEIAKDDPEGAQKALDITKMVMNNIAPDCLWMAVVQRDGKGGCWHVHVVQCAVHTSTLKACAGRETNRDIFMKQTEKFAEDYGLTLDSGHDHAKRKSKDKKSVSKQKHENAKQTDGFSWMDDLEQRIIQAALATMRAADFETELEKCGVKVKRKTKTGWTYALGECADERFIGKFARYDKFSMDLSNAMLHKVFDKNYRDAQSKVRDPVTGKRRLPDISGITGGEEAGLDMSDLRRR